MTYNEQSRFLVSCIEISEPKRRMVDEAVSKRQCSVKYTLPINNDYLSERMQVCQKYLTSTLSITRRRIQVINEKLKSGGVIDDLRGKHAKRPHKIIDLELKKSKRTY